MQSVSMKESALAKFFAYRPPKKTNMDKHKMVMENLPENKMARQLIIGMVNMARAAQEKEEKEMQQ